MTEKIKCYTEGCENEITEPVAKFSAENYGGKIFCYTCQHKNPRVQTEKKKETQEKSYIVKISGKDFMTYEGLLKKAHERGKFSMEITESWVSQDMKMAWCKVRLTHLKQTFDGFGSSTPENTGTMTQSHPVEMAHTRSKGRAFRDFLNIGMVMVEELKEQKKDE